MAPGDEPPEAAAGHFTANKLWAFAGSAPLVKPDAVQLTARARGR